MRVGIGKQKMLNLRPKQFRPISLMQNMCNFQCILLFYDCAYSRLLSIYSLFFFQVGLGLGLVHCSLVSYHEGIPYSSISITGDEDYILFAVVRYPDIILLCDGCRHRRISA